PMATPAPTAPAMPTAMSVQCHHLSGAALPDGFSKLGSTSTMPVYSPTGAGFLATLAGSGGGVGCAWGSVGAGFSVGTPGSVGVGLGRVSVCATSAGGFGGGSVSCGGAALTDWSLAIAASRSEMMRSTVSRLGAFGQLRKNAL